jgi:phenylpyruvate tautomerase PptA (4-oxalocrotonate tautomerase family)
MPLYEIEHSIPLSKAQRDQIAQAITQIHTRKFSTPSLFVNIRFTDCANQCLYIAGEQVSGAHFRTTLNCMFVALSAPTLIRVAQRSVNRILAFVRGGGPRTSTHLDELAEKILDAWNQIINGGKKAHGEPGEMKVVTIVGSISAGIESGFLLPPVRMPSACTPTGFSFSAIMTCSARLRLLICSLVLAGRSRYQLVEGKPTGIRDACGRR